MSGKSRFDDVLRALSDGYRRELLLALIDHNPQDDDDSDPLDIHTGEANPMTDLNIFMGHLPMLEEIGIIEWNQETDEVVKGPDWEEFEPLFQLIKENKDALPEEWFAETDS